MVQQFADALEQGPELMVKYVPDRTGRFSQRPHYEPKELDRECENIIAGFLTERHGTATYPVSTDDLTVLIKRDSESLDQFADLPSYGRNVLKGVSGNTKGRPRKKRAFVSTKVDGQPGIGFEDRIKSLAIEEAYRLITIREGDRVERIPVIQAILRKVAVAAANGNTRAQQNYLNLLIGADRPASGNHGDS
jgi:hypothetical protein